MKIAFASVMIAAALVQERRVLAGGAGTSDLGELDLPGNAAEAALGSGAAGLVDGASAVVTAPARLGTGARAGVGATHTAWVSGVTDSSISAYTTVEALGSVGAAYRFFRAGMTGTSEDPLGFFGAATGQIYYQNQVLTVAAAPDLRALFPEIPEGWRAGVAAFLVQRDDTGPVRYGYGINAQAIARTVKEMDVYLSGRNLGVIERRMLPMSFALGAVIRRPEMLVSDGNLAGVVELKWSRESGAGVGIAAEYAVETSVMRSSLRVGWSICGEKFATLLPTAGLAFQLASLTLEAGVAPLGNLGTAEVISLGWTGPKK